MDAIEALGALAADPEIGDRLTRLEIVPARPARFGETEKPLHPEVLERLAARGAERLYVHQAEAIDRLRAGRSVALATGTGSGKSLCYQAPIAESVLSGGKDTALLLFPTKALAHDQLRSLRSWLVPGMRAVAYDGDTPVEERAALRRTANVVLTNPEMLHVGILPYHDRWATFLMRLRYVVVDELHTLRGIFGSHVAHLLHRLRRVCLHYGARPAFCFASATIGNPAGLAAELCGLPVDAVDDDGSPKGDRAVALLDRPMVDPALGRRTSATAEVGGLLARLVGSGLRTIAFSPSRRSAEVVARQAQRRLEGDFGAARGPGRVPATVAAFVAARGSLAKAVAAYRGGYLPEERRQLETALSKGELLGVAATNALELGIDVAGLDAVVLQGFPGTLASFWQQAGRAGRALQPSVAILVAGDDQLDRWYLDHPTQLFTRSLEPAVVNPRNPFVAEPHVGCAAYELPLAPDDPVLGAGAAGFGEAIDDAVRTLVLADALKPRGGKMYWARSEAPAPQVGLRTGSSVEYRLYETESGRPGGSGVSPGRLVGTVDGARVFHIAHPGAIYLHQGRQYRVEHLDLDDTHALLTPVDVDEYTQPRHDIDIAITGEEQTRAVGRSTLHLGTVEVTTTTDAYQRRRLVSGEVLETVDLDLPPRTLSTRAGWYTVPVEVAAGAGLDGVAVLSAAHAAEHALIGMLPLFAICDRWDVGGVSMAVHPATGEPTIFIYDGYPGGAGIAELAFDAADRHVAAAHDVVAACPCEAGCPSCVQSPKCGNWNEYLDKRGAVALLRAMLGSGPVGR